MKGFSFGIGLFASLLILTILTFEIWMLVDAITNKQLDDTEKILWVLGMVLLHPFVAIAYYLVVYNKRPRL